MSTESASKDCLVRSTKRNYRFTDMDSLKEAAPKHANRVTAENYRYFFYRNLEELGSGGVRTDASSETRGDD